MAGQHVLRVPALQSERRSADRHQDLAVGDHVADAADEWLVRKHQHPVHRGQILDAELKALLLRHRRDPVGDQEAAAREGRARQSERQVKRLKRDGAAGAKQETGGDDPPRTHGDVTIAVCQRTRSTVRLNRLYTAYSGKLRRCDSAHFRRLVPRSAPRSARKFFNSRSPLRRRA